MGRRNQPHPQQDPVTALPPAMARTLLPLLGEDMPALEAALCRPPPTSIRLNPYKAFPHEAEAVPWCATGRYLAERPAFTFDPLLHAGAYYVQEASSMLLEQAVRYSGAADRDVLALDLCAAPGGKSTHLRSLLTPGSLLVANEVDPRRMPALRENLWKQGLPNVVLTGGRPEDLEALSGTFGLVLVDAPCSGEGMFRKDPFAREQWSEGLVDRCAAVQTGILEHAWAALAPGGTLIYSTCTWEPRENEGQLRPLVERGGIPLEVPLDPAWCIERTGIDGVIGHRCYPHRLRGEGFFLGMVRKPGEWTPHDAWRTSGGGAEAVGHWLRGAEEQAIIEQDGVLHAVGERWASLVREALPVVRVSAPGIPIAERKAGEWRPHPALALSILLDREAFPQVELDEAGALAYLRGEALPALGAHGTALATFRGRPIGWLHGAGRRWNNRWPAPWRIRAQQANAPRVPWA